MNYTDPVNFTKTGQYGCGPDDEDDVYTIEEFKNLCEHKMFIDYDGFGYPVREKRADKKIIVKPSQITNIPHDATHVVWFNK